MLPTHEQIMALRDRGVRIDAMYIPALAAVMGRYARAYGGFLTNIESPDYIVSQLEIGVDQFTDDDTISDQIENKAISGEIGGLIVEFSVDQMNGSERLYAINVTVNLFEEIVDFLATKV